MPVSNDIANVNNNIGLTIAIQSRLKSQDKTVPGIYNTVRFGKRVNDSLKMATYLTDCYLQKDE